MYFNVFWLCGTSWKKLCQCNTVSKSFQKKQRRVELKCVGNFVAKTVLVESVNQFSLEELCRTQYSMTYVFRSHIDHQTYGKTLKRTLLTRYTCLYIITLDTRLKRTRKGKADFNKRDTGTWKHLSRIHFTNMLFNSYIYVCRICYTPRNEVRGGILESPCPSVCPSVRPSVRLSVDARLGKMVSSA